MPGESFEPHIYEVPFSCNYLLRRPEIMNQDTLLRSWRKTDSLPAAAFAPLLAITLHGYGANPSDMLRLTAQAIGGQHAIAALQAPYQHYIGKPGSDAPSGYNWGTRQHWAQAVQTHHRMLKRVLADLGEQLRIGPERTVLIGFSQPVGLNYRFIGTEPGLVRGVVGICGGVPRDWDESKYGPVDAAILHISTEEDEFYPTDLARQFPERLRRHAADVEFHLLPGGHRFPSKAGMIVQPWLRRVFGDPAR